MAKAVLAAFAANDLVRAASLACHAALLSPSDSAAEMNALAATILGQAGREEAALAYWQAAITGRPHKLKILTAGIAKVTQFSTPLAAKYLADWYNLLESVYIKTPDAAFLASITERGWTGQGCVGISEGRLKGWVWTSVRPQMAVRADKPLNVNISLIPVARAGGKILYKLDSSLPESCAPFTVEIIANGHVRGSPLRVSPAPLDLPKQKGRLGIIIPVHDDYEATLSCIASLLASLRKNRIRPRIIAAWDAGPNQGLLDRLRKLAARRKIELLEARDNLGFLANVNQALARADGDVILLNADTLVYGDWIDRLAEAARGEDTATVTALGNEAELMSYPSFRERGKISRLSEVKMFDQAASRLDNSRVEIPVGVGFCMYITRQALRKIGGMDGKFLFRGYGEEVDYCLRASEAGLKNYGAFNVFVGHLGERSFGLRKKALASQNNVAIYRKFPSYKFDYEFSLSDGNQARLRSQLTKNLLADLEPQGELEARPWSGRFSPAWLTDKKHVPAKKGGALFLQAGKRPRALLRLFQGIAFADASFDLNSEADQLAAILRKFNLQAISHLRSDAQIRLAQGLGLELRKAPAPDELAELPRPSPAALLAQAPDSMGNWRRLLNFARANPATLIHVFHLADLWRHAPRPDNIQDMPLIENYQALAFEACLLWDAADLGGWRDWLVSHEWRNPEFFRLGEND